MKSLLLYNDNISSKFIIDFNNEGLGVTHNFQVGKQELLNPNFTIDKKINDDINNFDKDKYDCIFIPYSLSEENYIEFTGLRFACHIRLTPGCKNLQTPIIFYGADTITEVNKLSAIGTILFSKGVYTTNKITIEDFKKQVKYVVENYKNIDKKVFLEEFTKRVNILPSGNYTTHHSITNEWCIYRWATALKIDDKHIRAIENNIGSNLYFKYLKSRFPVKKIIEAKNKIILNEGRILYVDDEVEKGWDHIFKKICAAKKYESICADFKTMEAEEIVEITIKKVEDFDPDVIILDFRLHDDDFENTKAENITGYKILRKVKKEINEGIQIIVLSATNKIWNLRELQKAGADGFILKESPELSVDEGYSKNAIGNIYRLITTVLKRDYLKAFYTEISQLKSQLKESDFTDEIKEQLDLFWRMISKAQTKEDFSYSYVSLYLVIEIINKKFLNKIKEECYWNKEKGIYEFKQIEKLTEWNKIAYLYFKIWSGTDSNFVRDLYYLIRKRNGFVHNDRNIGSVKGTHYPV